MTKEVLKEAFTPEEEAKYQELLTLIALNQHYVDEMRRGDCEVSFFTHFEGYLSGSLIHDFLCYSLLFTVHSHKHPTRQF